MGPRGTIPSYYSLQLLDHTLLRPLPRVPRRIVHRANRMRTWFQLTCLFALLYSVRPFCRTTVPGSAINGPVAKECADLWPRIASNAGSIV